MTKEKQVKELAVELFLGDSEKQAINCLKEIKRIVDMIDSKDPGITESGVDTALQMPIEIAYRSGWKSFPTSEHLQAEEFRIMLVWGGPAVQITGSLDDRLEVIPQTIRMMHQDWGKPWLPLVLRPEGEKALATFCGCFSFDCLCS
jgi:hypothetical protein